MERAQEIAPCRIAATRGADEGAFASLKTILDLFGGDHGMSGQPVEWVLDRIEARGRV